ncbi:DUF6234 family protein [Streptomyces sp. NPDC001407]|uniref:DUF6234 family protein n=1 Tax=unclassified Streptomyces TaxID=2593676 RepID=UPI0033FEA224
MSESSSSQRPGTGQDLFVAVLLWVLDAIVGAFVLLAGLGEADYNIFEPDPHASMSPVFEYVAVFAGVVLLSAAALYRLGYRASVGAQVAAGGLLLLFCATGANAG